MKDVPAFPDAMEELTRNMLLCGYPEYEREADAFMTGAEKEREAARREHDSLEKAEQEKTA